MKYRFAYLLLLAAMAGASIPGCGSFERPDVWPVPPSVSPTTGPVVIIRHSDWLKDELDRRRWIEEIGKVYNLDRCVIWFCHGTEYEGSWMYVADMPSVESWYVAPEAASLSLRFPDRTIILVCCNPGHHHLNIPRVVYATDSVWFAPDSFLPFHKLTEAERLANEMYHSLVNDPGHEIYRETVRGEGMIGSIWEFTTGEPPAPSPAARPLRKHGNHE